MNIKTVNEIAAIIESTQLNEASKSFMARQLRYMTNSTVVPFGDNNEILTASEIFDAMMTEKGWFQFDGSWVNVAQANAKADAKRAIAEANRAKRLGLVAN